MNRHSTQYFLIALVLFAVFPSEVSAAEMRIAAHKVDIKTEEQFLVDVIIHSEEPLNAIEGQLTFPPDALTIREIHDGNSVVNFWVEKPHLAGDGVIAFSGITPGGFSGSHNVVFSILFEAKKVGTAVVALHGLKALLNDGLGTETSISGHDTAVSIKEGESTIRTETVVDKEPPEDFSPTIAHDPTLFEGKYFLVFATQDKGSGIDHYEVREGVWGWFARAESPYVLKNQSLDANIFVKAIDNAGNERVSVLTSPHPQPWYQQHALSRVGGVLLVILFVVGLLLKKLWQRFTQ